MAAANVGTQRGGQGVPAVAGASAVRARQGSVRTAGGWRAGKVRRDLEARRSRRARGGDGMEQRRRAAIPSAARPGPASGGEEVTRPSAVIRAIIESFRGGQGRDRLDGNSSGHLPDKPVG